MVLLGLLICVFEWSKHFTHSCSDKVLMTFLVFDILLGIFEMKKCEDPLSLTFELLDVVNIRIFGLKHRTKFDGFYNADKSFKTTQRTPIKSLSVSDTVDCSR